MNSDLGKRCEFHTHSLLSDGELLPSELVRRAEELNYACIAITDHVDSSNLTYVAKSIVSTCDQLIDIVNLEIIPGVELTHVPPSHIDELAKKARELGVKLVVVHGETIVEPVARKTNECALKCRYVDILAHPGIIDEKLGKLAASNRVFLEITTRRGHCLANGVVSEVAKSTEAPVLLNTDLHSPEEFITQNFAYLAAIASGLDSENAVKALREYPADLLNRVKSRK